MTDITFYYLTTDKTFDVTREQLIQALDKGFYGWVGTNPFGPGHHDSGSICIEPIEQEDDGQPDGYIFNVCGGCADDGTEAVETAEQYFRDEAEQERKWEEEEQRERGKQALLHLLGTEID